MRPTFALGRLSRCVLRYGCRLILAVYCWNTAHCYFRCTLLQNSQIVQKSDVSKTIFALGQRCTAQCLPSVCLMSSQYRPSSTQCQTFVCPISAQCPTNIHPMSTSVPLCAGNLCLITNQYLPNICQKVFTQILPLCSEPPRPIFGKLGHYSAVAATSLVCRRCCQLVLFCKILGLGGFASLGGPECCSWANHGFLLICF